MTKNKLLARALRRAEEKITPDFFRPPILLPGIVPAGSSAPVLAADNAIYGQSVSDFGMAAFPGFSHLAQLAARGEYRALAGAMASQVTRAWIEFTSTTEGNEDKIKGIEEEFKRLKIREIIRQACEQDCYFGRAQIYVGIRGAKDTEPLIINRKTVSKGSLDRICTIEAVWTTPAQYDALDPTAIDFYRPSAWYVLGRDVHASRLLTITTRPLPDILKPAYNFAGLSLSQITEFYVEEWLRTKKSVSDLLYNFSVTALKTDMAQTLQGIDESGEDILTRADLFNALRSNRGLMLLDKNQEDLIQLNTPLSGLHELQAQAQEHMCSISHIPATILTGISPSGLNASSEGELESFDDWVNSQQEDHWRGPIEMLLRLVQLNLFGEIDNGIDFIFRPLHQTTEIEKADIRLKESQTDEIYVNMGAVGPDEVRSRLISDKESGYSGLDADAVIMPPEVDDFSDDKSVSAKQHRAMAAAAEGKSTLGIPEKVGQEFIEKDKQ